MSAEQARDILARKYGIDSVVESHGVICLLDLSEDNIMTVRSILQEIGYNKTWGIRPKARKDVKPLIFEQDDTREKHAV